MAETLNMQRETLPLEGVMTRDQLIIQGLSMYCKGDRDHPAARFYIADDVLQQRIYEVKTGYTPPRTEPSEQAVQLILFAA